MFFCLFPERQAEPGRVEHPASPAGHDGELIYHQHAVFPVNRKFAPLPHCFCPFSSRWFGSNIFLWQGFNVVYADDFASYQWALQSDHRRLPGWMWNKSLDSQSLMFSRMLGASLSAGLVLFCTSFSTAGPINTSRCNFAVCSIKSIFRLHQAWRLYEADTWERDLSSAVDTAALGHQARLKHGRFASVAAVFPGKPRPPLFFFTVMHTPVSVPVFARSLEEFNKLMWAYVGQEHLWSGLRLTEVAPNTVE